MPTLDAASERTPFADEVLLSDELVKGPRSHPGSQWLPIRRGLEERFGSCPGGASRSGHGASMVRAGRASVRQNGPMPVTVTMIHSAKRSRTREPPRVTIRRTSRAT